VTDEKKKVVALLSGGLDSQLAVKMMQEQGFDVSKRMWF
jgi:tRNA U34 2-thiouridine synthase MnmA/TrmU